MKSALCVDENGQYGGIKRNKSGVMKSVRMKWYTLYTQPNKDILTHRPMYLYNIGGRKETKNQG